MLPNLISNNFLDLVAIFLLLLDFNYVVVNPGVNLGLNNAGIYIEITKCSSA